MMMIIWVVGGVVGGGFALREAMHLHDADGPPAGTATIVTAEKVRAGKGYDAYITFDVDGTQHRCRMAPDDIGDVNRGNTQSYWIIDGDPQVASCTHYQHRAAIAGIVFTGVAGVFVIATFAVFLWMRRRNWIYVNGDIAVARITWVKARRFRRATVCRIRFENERSRGKAFLDARYFFKSGHTPPEPGTETYVAFDPNKPEKALFYGLKP